MFWLVLVARQDWEPYSAGKRGRPSFSLLAWVGSETGPKMAQLVVRASKPGTIQSELPAHTRSAAHPCREAGQALCSSAFLSRVVGRAILSPKCPG